MSKDLAYARNTKSGYSKKSEEVRTRTVNNYILVLSREKARFLI